MNRFFLICCLWLLGFATAEGSPLEGDWFIVTSRNRLSCSDPKHPVAKAMEKYLDKDHPKLRFVAFAPAGGWFLQHAHGFEWTNVPASLVKKNEELGKNGRGIHWLAFRPQGGWALVDTKNELAGHGIPTDLLNQLLETTKLGGKLRSLAFTPAGGWVLLFEENFRQGGLPKDLHQKLTEHYQKQIPVRCVAFSSQSDWFLLNERNECFCSNANHPAYKKLEELRTAGQVLHWIAFSPGEYTHGYVLEHTPVKRVKTVVTLDIDAPKGDMKEWIVFAPVPPELNNQRDVKAHLTPAGALVQEASPLKRMVLRSRVTDQPKGIQAKLACEMTLYETRLLPRLWHDAPAKTEMEPPLVPWYLRKTEFVDFDGKIVQDFLDRFGLRRAASESDMSFARRTFLSLRQYLKYGALPKGVDVRASTVCQGGVGDCGGQSTLFVAVLRANHVPARLLIGGIVPEKKASVDLDGHVRSEFFARGVGWVPVDMTFSNGTPFGFFGDVPANMVMSQADTDLIVEPFADKPAKLVWLGNFASWWVGGSGVVGLVKTSPWHTEVSALVKETVPAPVVPPSAKGIDLQKTTAEIASSAGGTKDEERAERFPWLLVASISAGLLLLVLGLVMGKRRNPSANNPPPAPTQR